MHWSRLPTNARVVALTFDAGACATGAPSILSTLAREGVRATFFLTGAWTSEHPDLSREIAATHVVGNHTQDHPHLPSLSDNDVRDEVSRAEAEIQSVTGRDPRPLFRFPYGEADPRTLAIVNQLGYLSVRWTIDTLGWKGGGAGGQTAESVVARVVAGLSPGAIVIMHLGEAPDGSTLDADALPTVISRIRAAGYGFVTVDQYL